jgi:hypothetical protein
VDRWCVEALETGRAWIGRSPETSATCRIAIWSDDSGRWEATAELSGNDSTRRGHFTASIEGCGGLDQCLDWTLRFMELAPLPVFDLLAARDELMAAAGLSN